MWNSSYRRRLLCSIQYPQRQNPKRGDEERGWLPSEEILVSEGSEFALTVSELELVWTTWSFEAQPPFPCGVPKRRCLWTTNLNLIVEATAPNQPGSVSTRKG